MNQHDVDPLWAIGQAERTPPRRTEEPCWRGLVVVAPSQGDGANYAIAGVLWRVAARLRIAVSTTSGWESIGTWLLSTA